MFDLKKNQIIIYGPRGKRFTYYLQYMVEATIGGISRTLTTSFIIFRFCTFVAVLANEEIVRKKIHSSYENPFRSYILHLTIQNSQFQLGSAIESRKYYFTIQRNIDNARNKQNCIFAFHSTNPQFTFACSFAYFTENDQFLLFWPFYFRARTPCNAICIGSLPHCLAASFEAHTHTQYGDTHPKHSKLAFNAFD